MCGIVGVFTTRGSGFHRDEIKSLYNLVIADAARGEDGTGMFWLDENRKRWFWKEAETAGACLNRRLMEGFLDEGVLAVCHNRAATIGGNTKAMTHPFHYGDIIGVHNGTVHGWRAQFPQAKAEMDSAAIFEALAATDPDPEAVNEVLKKADTGAYALVWHDMRVNELRMVRNADRPLFVVGTHHAMWFGSELRMLEWALYRNTENPQVSFKLDTHTLMCVNDKTGKSTLHNMERRAYSYQPYSTGYGYNYNWNTGKQDADTASNNSALNRFGDDDVDGDLSQTHSLWREWGYL